MVAMSKYTINTNLEEITNHASIMVAITFSKMTSLSNFPWIINLLLEIKKIIVGKKSL